MMFPSVVGPVFVVSDRRSPDRVSIPTQQPRPPHPSSYTTSGKRGPDRSWPFRNRLEMASFKAWSGRTVPNPYQGATESRRPHE